MATETIGCILTVYRRSQNLGTQLATLRKQSIQPNEILIWQNETVPKVILPNLSVNIRVVKADPNMGVWPRFLIGMEMQSEYLCVFDDDTIPGTHWLENCLTHMKQKPGMYGTVGIRFKGRDRTPYDRLGWPSANDNVEEVDLVGHSWFFKRDWLRYYALEPRQSGPTCGEDYHFSVALQKHLKLGTYVPPHRAGRKREWGSLKGTELGTDQAALYRQKGENSKKTVMHRAYIRAGWKTLAMRRKSK